MTTYNHDRNDYIFIDRYIDKNCFGRVRAVNETRRIKQKNIRIHNGRVEARFRNEWIELVETAIDEMKNDRMVRSTTRVCTELGLEKVSTFPAMLHFA